MQLEALLDRHPLCYNITFWTWLQPIPIATAPRRGTPTDPTDQPRPHPAQAAPWSILRMTVLARLGAAAAVSAGLWAVVWLAMR